jgi:hypothetical protein
MIRNSFVIITFSWLFRTSVRYVVPDRGTPMTKTGGCIDLLSHSSPSPSRSFGLGRQRFRVAMMPGRCLAGRTSVTPYPSTRKESNRRIQPRKPELEHTAAPCSTHWKAAVDPSQRCLRFSPGCGRDPGMQGARRQVLCRPTREYLGALRGTAGSGTIGPQFEMADGRVSPFS